MSAAPQQKRSPRRRQSALHRSTMRQPARRRLTSHSRQQPQRASRLQLRQRGVALEMGILLSVNLVVVAAATAAIVKLVPHHIAQRAKLQVLQSEVDALDHRVNRLRRNFNAYFDPQRSLTNQRELGNQAVPGQRPVRFIQPQQGNPSELGSGR